MTERSTTRVLISGGGVAGPALAYWLQRYGFEPMIVEKAPRPRSSGQRVEIGEAGQDVLSRMGLLDRAKTLGGAHPRSTVYTGAGDRPVRVPDIGAHTPGTAHTGRLTIKRSDLGELLHERVRDTVPYIFGASITALRQEPDSVQVQLDSGATHHTDLVIGADGLYSTVRRLAFGEHNRFLHYLGADEAYFTMENYLGWTDVSRFHAWPGRAAAITTFPGNAELEGMFLLRSTKTTVTREMDQEARLRRIEQVFGDDEWLVPSMLRAMRSATDFRLMPCLQVRMDSWHTGRVGLVGDAAHCPDPIAGQGAALALIGAYILAGELAAAAGNPAVAFAANERTMREFVSAGQKLGELDIAVAAPRGGRTRTWVHEQSQRVLFPLVELGLRAGIRPHRLTATQSITLPDYERSEATGHPAKL